MKILKSVREVMKIQKLGRQVMKILNNVGR
jgi:hypothetical protein